MSRPRIFLDPVHRQMGFPGVDLGGPLPGEDGLRSSWVLQHLIDSPEFQRLRSIRQNALVYLAFQGAEHTRFCHSMGVSWLAGRMYDRVVRNMGERPDPDERLATCVAGLLHDLGHGPFSHNLEQILHQAGVPFDHERMSLRYLREDTAVSRVLRQVDPALPARVAAFLTKDDPGASRWTHKLVSSQLDADRLDYLLRDAAAAGLPEHTFDLDRILEMLEHLDGRRIAVDRRAIAPLEVYLVTLHHMYRIVYFHKTVRAADQVLSGALRRALELHRGGDRRLFPDSLAGGRHPLLTLLETGEACPLEDYTRLGEHHVWARVEEWRHHPDPVLSDLSRRILGRALFRARDLAGWSPQEIEAERARVEARVIASLPHVDADTVGYYVTVDAPERTSYKTYDWRGGDPDDSIWIIRDDGPPQPVEEYGDSEIVNGLRGTRSFPRLVYPKEVGDDGS